MRARPGPDLLLNRPNRASRFALPCLLALPFLAAPSLFACGGTTAAAPVPAHDAGPEATGVAPDPPRRADSGPTFCQKNTGHTFCADFDLAPDGYTAGWDYDQSSETTRLETVPSDRSSPYALHVAGDAYDPDGGYSDPSAMLDKVLSGIDPSNIHFAFDVRIDALGLRANDPSPVTIAGLGVYAGPSLDQVGSLELEVSSTATRFYAYISGDHGQPDLVLTDLPRGRWVHVDLTMVGTPDATRVAVTYDGVPAGAFELGAGTYRGDMVDAHIGALRPFHTDATSIAFDNVTLDL